MTWRVLRRPEFPADPHGAANAITGPKAGNGALMRTAPCAFTPDPAAYAAHLCAVTHSDPLCVATCIAQSLLVRELALAPHDSKIDPETLSRSMATAMKDLPGPQRREMMTWAMKSTQIGLIDIGSRDARGYTLKSFACSLWAFRALLRHRAKGTETDAGFFKRVMTQIVMEAGDADTNAAVAGAVLGAAIGYSRLPADWIGAMPNREWLSEEAKKFMRALRG